MKILILGAGVGGLSCAHELIKQGHEVHIYERNSEVGGQARSKWKEGLHTEYCWHVVGKNYFNLWRILKEIPLEEASPFNTSSVADNLKPITKYIYGREGKKNTYIEEGNSFLVSGSFFRYVKALYNMGTLGDITLYDFFKLLQIKILTMLCVERLKDYDDILWLDFTKYLSDEAKKWISYSPSIYLGMNIDTLSTHTMLSILRPIKENKDKKYDFYSFNGPINDQWFDPWVRYLQQQGVIFHFEEIQNVVVENNEIKGIIVNGRFEKADYYINSLPVEVLASFFPMYRSLAERSHQIQTQIIYYIDKKLDLDSPSILIFPDTQWCLMIRPEGPLWDVPLDKKQNFKGKDILSVGIGIWSVPGINNKKAIGCTLEELAQECWNQLKASRNLFDTIKTTDGFRFDDVHILKYTVWDSFKYINGKINTWEPKFSNGVGTLKLRPKTDDKYISNLKHATAYTITDANIFNMESACEAGVRAAYSFINKELEKRSGNYTLISKIDSLIYNGKIFSISLLIFIFLLLCIFIF